MSVQRERQASRCLGGCDVAGGGLGGQVTGDNHVERFGTASRGRLVGESRGCPHFLGRPRTELVTGRRLAPGSTRLADPQVRSAEVQPVAVGVFDALEAAGSDEYARYGFELADELRRGKSDVPAALPVAVQKPNGGSARGGESLVIGLIDRGENARSVRYRNADNGGVVGRFVNVRDCGSPGIGAKAPLSKMRWRLRGLEPT